MVKSAFFKTVARTFRKNVSRFVSMCLIVFVGVAFVTGVGTLSHVLTRSVHEEYVRQKGADLFLKSTLPTGFSEEEMGEIALLTDAKGVRKVFQYEEGATRFVVTDIADKSTHVFSLEEGRQVRAENEIYAERTLMDEVGDTVVFMGKEYTVVGKLANPACFSIEKEIGNQEQEIEHIYYLDSAYFEGANVLPVTDLYLEIDSLSKRADMFSGLYELEMQALKEKIEEAQENTVVLTLEENISYALVKGYGEKINVVAAIFPVFFILIVSLVVLTTMTRLIEDERGMIGCYRTLGFSKGKILLKYSVFSVAACLIGAIVGVAAGMYILPNVIYPSYNAMFYMGALTPTRVVMPGILSALVMAGAVWAITAYVLLKELSEKPSALLKAKSPKAGKRILLERIPWLWKRLKFRYKSSLRNVIRYKTHLVMTVVSVAGSTALVLAGFGLYNIALSPNTTTIPNSMADAFAMISLIVILFSALLCILVIFNLTNMNIQERNKEMATLRVLGYQHGEVGAYIYREVAIMTVIGIFFGIPLGVGLLAFVFGYLEFGLLADVRVLSYVFTVLLVFVFVAIVDVLLYRKVKKIDMNASLKSNE